MIFVTSDLSNNTELTKLVAELWEHGDMAKNKSDEAKKHKQSDDRTF